MFKNDNNFFEEIDIFHSSYLYENLRILSLTETNDNILMWSHYADSSRGICIEYELIDNEIINNMFLVVYIEKPINLTYLINKNQTEKNLKLYIYLSTILKYYIWEYEKEWRLVFLSNCELDKDFLDFKIKKYFRISKIYLGRNFFRYIYENKQDYIYSKFIDWLIESKIDTYIMINKQDSFKLIPEKIKNSPMKYLI